MDIINWIMAHWMDIGAIIAGVVAVASLVVKLTPTPKDDAILAKVIKVMNALALNPKTPK